VLYENSVTGAASNVQGIQFYNCGGGHAVRNNLMYATEPGGLTGILRTQILYTTSDNAINERHPNMRSSGE